MNMKKNIVITYRCKWVVSMISSLIIAPYR